MQRSWAVRSYGGALDCCLLAAGKTASATARP
jgi:hypothetical protein